MQLTDELERAKEDLHDINEFLTNQLKGSALKVAGLEARVKELESKLLVQDKAHQAGLCFCYASVVLQALAGI